MPSKRLSDKEFQEFLRALFSDDKLKVKYNQPDAWRRYPTRDS